MLGTETLPLVKSKGIAAYGGGRRLGLPLEAAFPKAVSSFSGLLVALDFLVEGRKSWVPYGTKFLLERGVRHTNLEHHADEVIYYNIGPICFVHQGKKLFPEFDHGLPFLLAGIKELLTP